MNFAELKNRWKQYVKKKKYVKKWGIYYIMCVFVKYYIFYIFVVTVEKNENSHAKQEQVLFRWLDCCGNEMWKKSDYLFELVPINSNVVFYLFYFILSFIFILFLSTSKQ